MLLYTYFYLLPTSFNNISQSISPLQQSQPSFTHIDKKLEFHNNQKFLQLFEKQLRKTSLKYTKKLWTKQQDTFLSQLKVQDHKWKQISQKIPNTTPQICKRRYLRIKYNQQKWPTQLEKQIQTLCEQSPLKWNKKIQILSKKFPSIKNYSKKMIKQRYLTHLKPTILQKPWTIDQDLLLISTIRNTPKKWKSISHLLPGRTQLHLKNRYYGCLRAIQQKISGIISHHNQK